MTTITPKSLADGTLPTTTGTLYTCPAATRTVIKKISYVNGNGAPVVVNCYVTRSGRTTRRITPKGMTLGTGYLLDVVEDDVIFLSAGDTIDGDGSTAGAIDYFISGVEET